MTLHIHENQNALSYDDLVALTEARRTQRLLIAIDTHAKRVAKLSKMSEKARTQYTKLGDATVTILAKVEVLLDKCDANLHKMGTLAHNRALLDDEINVLSATTSLVADVDALLKQADTIAEDNTEEEEDEEVTE